MYTIDSAITYLEAFFSHYHRGSKQKDTTSQQRLELLDTLRDFLVGSLVNEVQVSEQQHQLLQEYLSRSAEQTDSFFVDLVGQESYTQMLKSAVADIVGQVVDLDYAVPGDVAEKRS